MTLSMPREGMLIPAFELPRGDGGSLRIRAYRGRRGLALVFTHAANCSDCRRYLVTGLEMYSSYAEEDAELIVVTPDEADAVSEMRRTLALPFPVLIDAGGVTFDRYGLIPNHDAAVLVANRYGVPRLWQIAGADHALPAHSSLLAELRYLALTCSGGCSVPLWPDLNGGDGG